MSSSQGHIEAFVFDCGDTMLALDPPRAVVCRDVLEEMGIEVPLTTIRQAYALVDFSFKLQSSRAHNDDKRDDFYRGYNSALAEALGLSSRLDAFDRAQKIAFKARVNWSPLPGLREALEALSRRADLFVLANWDKGLRALLQRHDLDSFFCDICDSETLGAEKPDPAAYAAFITRTNVNPSKAVYIGNEYKADVWGSRGHGFSPVLMDHAKAYGPYVDCAYFTSWDELVNSSTPLNAREAS